MTRFVTSVATLTGRIPESMRMRCSHSGDSAPALMPRTSRSPKRAAPVSSRSSTGSASPAISGSAARGTSAPRAAALSPTSGSSLRSVKLSPNAEDSSRVRPRAESA